MTDPYLRERAQTGFNEKRDFKAGIAIAQVDNALFEYEPITPPADGNAGKSKFDNVPALARRRFGENVPADVPHQKVGIQVGGVNEIVPEPALRPKAHFLDDWK